MSETKFTHSSLERCETLLDAVVRFMERNPLAAEHTVFYDEAECDGNCLRDDCEAELQVVRGIIAKARGEHVSPAAAKEPTRGSS